MDEVCYKLIDGTLVDLSANMPEGAVVVRQDDPIGREVVRHSAAHVMAQAVVSLWPNAKYTIGPSVEDPPGFYYDFDVGASFTQEDLERIEAKMAEIIAEDQPFVREEVSLEEATTRFADQPFKIEILNGIGDESEQEGVDGDHVSLYHNGQFVDLCRGPHVSSTGQIRSFKLLRSSGAHWRGDSKRPMLQRIYGTAWESAEALNDYLARVEEASKRDHVKVGRELELFHTHELVGSGLPLWMPKGSTIRRLLEEYILDEERKAGYQHVYTPDMGKRELYELSGHWDHFQGEMFPVMQLEHEQLVLKPMNCPHHILIYSANLRSYRELPLRIAELGRMHRYERSGVVRGLSRVRTMTLNDAHIFCTPDQIADEFAGVMRLVEKAYATLGIVDYRYQLSLHDPSDTEKYVQNEDMWKTGEESLRRAMDSLGLDYDEAPGEANFYGPKLDIQLTDLLGREETYSTVQLDFHLPAQFGLHYIGEDGDKHTPVIIHRAIISSMERIVAYLIELYGGAFPTWLAPVQAVVIPIGDDHLEYGRDVAEELRKIGVRVEVDADGSLGNRIRKGQELKIPYMLVVGDKEAEARAVAPRKLSGKPRKEVPLNDFLFEISEDISQRKLPAT